MQSTIKQSFILGLLLFSAYAQVFSHGLKVVILPADNIKKVTACTDKVYAVDNFLLKEDLGKELSQPGKNPEFTGGDVELKKYFAANSVTNEKAKDRVLRVAIAFMVTCEGKAGNFKVISKGKGELETIANEVLATVNKMPQNWKPALVDGKAVDCYQVLTFTVLNGSLEKVSYK